MFYFKLKANSNKYKARRRSISLSVLALTLTFILFTAPKAILFGYYLENLKTSEPGKIIIGAISCLSTTYHSLNLVVLLVIEKHFYKEFKLTFAELRWRIRIRKAKISPLNKNITVHTINKQ